MTNHTEHDHDHDHDPDHDNGNTITNTTTRSWPCRMTVHGALTWSCSSCIVMVKATTVIAGIKGDNPVIFTKNTGRIMPVIQHAENAM